MHAPLEVACSLHSFMDWPDLLAACRGKWLAASCIRQWGHHRLYTVGPPDDVSCGTAVASFLLYNTECAVLRLLMHIVKVC